MQIYTIIILQKLLIFTDTILFCISSKKISSDNDFFIDGNINKLNKLYNKKGSNEQNKYIKTC
jgi:hypothetical protein